MAKYENYSIAGGIQENTSDSDSKPIDFRILKNCYADRKLGKLLKRDGSATETITGTLGVPLGVGELLAEASGSLIPLQRILLFNFAGSQFRRYKNSAYTTVTPDANTSFSTTKKNTFAQGGETLFIAGGRPAFYTDGGDVERVGIPAPSTAPTVVAGAGTGLTGTFRYAYTFYDSTSGRESDLSPTASVTLANDDADLSALETTVAAANVDQKRIYRTLKDGEIFYLQATKTLATTSYTDSTADADLGIQAADIGEYGMPPSTSYICAYFNKRMWWVDADNPNKIQYSSPHIGSDNALHRYPTSNFLICDKPVTGLLVTPNKLLVMHPRDVSFISGFGDDLRIQPFTSGAGTMFPNGFATNGDMIFGLSEEGLVKLDGAGKILMSRPIDDSLREIMNATYSNNVYVDIAWSTNLRQFLIMLSAISSSNAPWVKSGIGSLAKWVDTVTGDEVLWQDTVSPSDSSVTRVKIWGYSPETDFFHEYEFPQIADLNDSGAYATFMHHPNVSSDTLELTQDATFMGVWNGTAGEIVTLFRRDKTKDDGSDISSEWLTSRLKPGDQTKSFKRVHSVMFPGSASDPSTNGTIKYLRDIDDPEEQSFVPLLEDFTDDGDLKILQRGKLRWMHIYGTDTASSGGSALLSEFKLRYIDRNFRNNR